MHRVVRVVGLVAAFLIAATLAAAQDRSAPEDPADSARFQWGILRFTPSIAVTNVGIDSNVFNDANTALHDTTAAIGPAVSLWTNLGPVRVSEKSTGQYLYFKEFDNQRSWNTTNELTLELPLARFKPFAAGSYVNTRQRPGFEIDSRSRASINTATLGTSLRLSGKTALVLGGTRSTTAFDEDETFLGAGLAAALNRRTDTELLQFRYALTPLTTLVVNAEAIQERFDEERVRNSDSIRVLPGFEFKPFALVSGRASVGFRRFNVLSDTIEDYTGVVASVDAKYRLTTSTQIAARVERDVTYSFEEAFPYYTLTDTGLTLTQRITRSWDVVASGGLVSLAYRELKTAPASAARTDKARTLGLGVGYRVGQTLRVGADVYYFSRRSEKSERDYDGLRAGASVSYGL